MLDFELIIFLILLTFITFLFQRKWIKLMYKKGKVGRDIHKEGKPEVAEMGGIPLIIMISAFSFFAFYLEPNYYSKYLIIIFTALIAGIIGIIDDIKDLGGKVKPASTLLASIPILITGSYDPHPSLPFIPKTSLTIVYPFLIPIGIAITSNAVNMLNVVNGSTPLLVIPILFTLIFISLISSKMSLIPLLIACIIALLIFFYYNKYPAKTFMGNSGDFFIGGLLGAIAIVYSLEFIVMVSMLPFIMHGFFVISSVKNFLEKKQIKDKPVIIKDGLLFPSLKKEAPLTLMRLCLAEGPLKEKDIAIIFFILSTVSSILAFLTYFLTQIKLI